MERDRSSHPLYSETELAAILARQNARKAIISRTLAKANQALIKEGITTGGEIHLGWNAVDCFFLYDGPGDRVLHIRVRPVPDDKRKLKITMRELDRERMLEERQRVSTGDEHQALVRTILEPTLIPNNSASITKLLRQELMSAKKA